MALNDYLDSQSAMGLFTLVAMIFIAVGFVYQDWSAEGGTGTQGPNDDTWGTYVTDYLLGAEAAVFALLLPHVGLSQRTFAAGFWIDCVGFTVAAVLHHFFAAPGNIHDLLWWFTLMLPIISGFLKIFGVAVATKELGECQCCPVPKVLGGIFGVLTVLTVVVLFLAEYEHIPVPGWIVLASKQVILTVVLGVYGLVLKMPRWSAALFVSFGLSVLVNLAKPEPFNSSTHFNADALFHCLLMVFYVCQFGYFTELTDMQKSLLTRATEALAEEFEHIKDTFEDFQPPARGCCSCGGPRRK